MFNLEENCNHIGIWCGQDEGIEDANITLFTEAGTYKYGDIEDDYTYLKASAFNNITNDTDNSYFILDKTFYMW